MHYLRLLIIVIATICVLALGVLALVTGPSQLPGDDVIIIKGGSLEITCGKNHGKDCLGTNDNKGKYKHKKSNAHITRIVVTDAGNANNVHLDKAFDPANPPQIDITYKEMATGK